LPSGLHHYAFKEICIPIDIVYVKCEKPVDGKFQLKQKSFIEKPTSDVERGLKK
jgi:hypothetical protein